MNSSGNEFSVLMSVYAKDDVIFFAEALNSLYEQTTQASEVVLIGDGTLTKSHYEVIDRFSTVINVKFFQLERNQGLAHALQIGLGHCSYDWVCRMDSDDICIADRFEKQLRFLKHNPDVDVLGGQISEFNETGVLSNRIVKMKHADILKQSKYLSPVNHVTVIYRKQKVIEAGGYNMDYTGMEDYPLWLKLLSNGAKFHNLSDVLVDVRVNDIGSRRSGLGYAVKEAKMFCFFYNRKFIKFRHLVINLSIRFPVRVFGTFLLDLAYKVNRRKAR
ncbi:glycosyl transferase [Agarivorans sp. OAG1]|uniref:glycosyltransferase n=1 Tax=Agarivorans sp. OAG1 TaxID=3082387 RepID=UPI002B29D14A|nr:glycosyl transferase [Agarivorans sp. OAG1]